MHSYILIDTNIWHFALVKPREEEFSEIHYTAKNVLGNLLSNRNIRVAMSTYQVAEIIEVLRRSGVEKDVRDGILEDFKTGKFFIKPLEFDVVVEALRDASQSNIHIYDYLVAYPLRDIVDRIYTADSHFFHEHFRFAEVVNPIKPWVLREGVKPFKLE